MGKKNLETIADIIHAVDSDDVSTRMYGWTSLHAGITHFQAQVTEEALDILLSIAWAERDPTVRNVAEMALVALAAKRSSAALALAKTLSGEGGGDAKPTLGGWLFEPFRQTSAVVGVTATDYRRRDEPALTCLGRRLSFDGFPLTEFPQIALDNPDLIKRVNERRYEAICIVGRLGLYGQEAVKQLSGERLRFGFLSHHRPKNLPKGQLDPDYHCVTERTGSGAIEHHLTSQTNSAQTDFGLVQRYTVKLGVRYIVVVVCAGASSLGTLAAAQWAADQLFRWTHPGDKQAIELPSQVADDSVLEVLLCVTAPKTTSAWENLQITLETLLLDGSRWTLEGRKWVSIPLKVVTLVYDVNGTTVQVLFDGTPSSMKSDSDVFQIMVSLAECSLATPGQKVTAKELVERQKQRVGRAPNVDSLPAQMRNLKNRYLRDQLLISNDGYELLPRVDVQRMAP
jgi:hypothetical protein